MRKPSSIVLSAAVLSCVLSVAGAAGAEEPGFEGFVTTETEVATTETVTTLDRTSVTTVSGRRVATLDLAAVDAQLVEAEAASLRALDAMKGVMLAADKEEGDFWRAYGKDAYATMRSQAGVVGTELITAQAALREVSRIFSLVDGGAPVSAEVRLAVLERVALACRVFTLYRAVVGYAHAKPLRYETALPIPFNELRVRVAEDVRPLSTPMVRFSTTSEATTVLRVYTMDATREGLLVQRLKTIAAGTRTTVTRTLPATNLDALVAELGGVVARARERQAKLRASSVGSDVRSHDDHNGPGYNYHSLEYRGELKDFESTVKPLAADFAALMARGLAVHEELSTWMNVAHAYVEQLNQAAAIGRCMREYKELRDWGRGWLVCYDSFGHLERQFLLIPE